MAANIRILHGDDRVYNNIFVQKYPVKDKKKTAADSDYEVVGTAPFDIFPTYEEWADQFDFEKRPDMGGLAKAHFGHLPVWIEGNAYFGGATVYKKEKNNLVNKKAKPVIELTQKKDGWYLKTSLGKELGDFENAVITTATLGKAFEPEQYFENPDGTPITFDSDYLGNHREGSVIPGPLAVLGNKETKVW